MLQNLTSIAKFDQYYEIWTDVQNSTSITKFDQYYKTWTDVTKLDRMLEKSHK